MKPRIADSRTDDTFPPPPVEGSELLVPITSWTEMFFETEITNVEFDEFWDNRVEEGVAYFFCWMAAGVKIVVASAEYL
jgi:hypothetical protein